MTALISLVFWVISIHRWLVVLIWAKHADWVVSRWIEKVHSQHMCTI
jgi:hypothetical protein